MKFYTLGKPGLVQWAICTDLSLEEALIKQNRENPTGISSRWQLSKKGFQMGNLTHITVLLFWLQALSFGMLSSLPE
jgi:hypothetical protein